MIKIISLIVFFFVSSILYASAELEGLKLGEQSPVQKVNTITGVEINLAYSKFEYILVFYRGSWCPYCMTQLQSIQAEVMPKVDSSKVKIVSISVDKKSIAEKMAKKFKYTFDVVSDPKADLLKAFKIANKIDDELVNKYKTAYKIDIEEDSGEKHHIVAHPAVFIIKEGKIKYKDVHIDYKQRTKNDEILQALEK